MNKECHSFLFGQQQITKREKQQQQNEQIAKLDIGARGSDVVTRFIACYYANMQRICCSYVRTHIHTHMPPAPVHCEQIYLLHST